MSRLTRSSSPALRYRKAHVCEHLASQYVTGVMTPRVRARLEKLLPITPELNRAVAFWSDRVADLHFDLPESEPSQHVWQKIDQATQVAQKAKTKSTSWWESLFFWKTAGISGLVSSLALAIILLTSGIQQSILTPPLTPNYMAAMSAHDSAQSGERILFVVNAYKKTEERPSTLFVQWSQDEKQKVKGLNLWAEDKVTGKLTYIGVEPQDGSPWHLDKASWQAISNSSRLLVTWDKQQPSATNTLFSGPCIQLSDWKV